MVAAMICGRGVFWFVSVFVWLSWCGFDGWSRIWCPNSLLTGAFSGGLEGGCFGGGCYGRFLVVAVLVIRVHICCRLLLFVFRVL